MDWLIRKFNEYEVKFYFDSKDEILAHGADVLQILKGDTSNAARIIANNVREKWWTDHPNPNGGKPIRCLYEPGLYQLASSPNYTSEFALQFQDWLFEETLPRLRNKGLVLAQMFGETFLEYQDRCSQLEGHNRDLLNKTIFLEQQLNKAVGELKYYNVEFGKKKTPNLQNMRYQQVYSELQDMCPRAIWVAAHKKVVKLCPELKNVIPPSMLRN